MRIVPINSEDSYSNALERIFQLAETAMEGTVEYNELEILSTLVEAYEKKEYPIEADPIEVIKLKLAYKGLTQKDLEGVIASKGYISKLLNYEKPLTLPLIRLFQEHLDLEPKSLIDPYPTGWQKEYSPFINYIEHKWKDKFKTQIRSNYIYITYSKNDVSFEIRDKFIRASSRNKSFYEGKDLAKAINLAVKKQLIIKGILSNMPKRVISKEHITQI